MGMQGDRPSAVAETAVGEAVDKLDGATDEFSQLVSCKVDREEFAIDILSVQEINRMVDITRVPKAPQFVEGVINLRGRIVPVLDLRRRFGLPPAPLTAQTRIVVVTVRSRVVGLIVDSVSEVLRISRSSIGPAPTLGTSIGAEFIQAVGRLHHRLLNLLDLNRLLTASEQSACDGVKG
jgi:purine-binding chemotaxis protein CheW